MRRFAAIVSAVLTVVGCSKDEPQSFAKRELSAPVREALYRISKLERTSTSDHSAKVIDVSGMSAADFLRTLKEFPGRDISVINGRYGPYIKHAGSNYKIPKDLDAGALTEAECQKIIDSAPAPSAKKYRKYSKKSR